MCRAIDPYTRLADLAEQDERERTEADMEIKRRKEEFPEHLFDLGVRLMRGHTT